MTETPLDFAGLYRRHAPDVLRFALYLSGDRMHAEDIVSDTFVRVGARDRLELPTVRAYLFAIARNVFLQSRRRQERQESIEADRSDRGHIDRTGGRSSSRRRSHGPWALQTLPEPELSGLCSSGPRRFPTMRSPRLGSHRSRRESESTGRAFFARRTSQEEP
ncbi:MAG: sigma-70 family RNA polymerase sigma factor [Candidatus Eisenbacteria bacterium]